MTELRGVRSLLIEWGMTKARRDDLIVYAYKAGLPAYMIGSLMQIDEHTVRRVLNRRGVPIRRGPAPL